MVPNPSAPHITKTGGDISFQPRMSQWKHMYYPCVVSLVSLIVVIHCLCRTAMKYIVISHEY